ncbi:hypothetical protein GW17_00004158 [Ensete ventricosum]|nr:hypothetical protein GW17_00004158 [Ensete ventricosum]
MEAGTSSSIEPLLSSRASYARSLTHVSDKLKSFQSYLRSIYSDQSNANHNDL